MLPIIVTSYQFDIHSCDDQFETQFCDDQFHFCDGRFEINFCDDKFEHFLAMKKLKFSSAMMWSVRLSVRVCM